MTKRSRMALGALCCATALAACVTTDDSRRRGLPPGAGYVAMGSSFAAGPGVTTSADQPPNRCARSTDNYAHVLARTLSLNLADVSCSGATTQHILGPWDDLPPQIDALTRETRLVTVTIGGNDVGYAAGLGSASCRSFASPPPGTPGGRCPPAPQVTDAAWTNLDDALRRIASEVHRRSPDARLIFVDYVSLLPGQGTCAAVPLSAAQADAGRATAARLAALTARVASEAGAEVLRASALSTGHDACSATPWVNGFPLPGGRGFVPYHPNALGMAAIASRLAAQVKRER